MSDFPASDLPVFPSLEELIGLSGERGWSDFYPPVRTAQEQAAADSEAERKTRTKQETEREKAARSAALLYARDADFRALLAHMAKGTLHKPLLLSPLNLPVDQAYAYGQFREGQNATVYMIFKLIAEGREQAIEPRGEGL